MSFKVFISHSTKDFGFVNHIKYWLNRNLIDTYIFEEDSQPGTRVYEKIVKAIDTSECVLAIMTVDGSRSQWVRDEIVYAIGKKKLVIPIVEEGVQIIGFLEGIEYISYKPDDPEYTIGSVVEYLTHKRIEKESKQKGNAILVISSLILLALSGER